jgi:serine/threonine-protein kinase
MSKADAREANARHRILLELGEGGTAHVYLAVARGPGDFNKLVVLKVLRADLLHSAEVRPLFLREARVAARLNHPHVVQTYEVLDEGESPIIVMEYLEGQPLSRILQRSTPPEAALGVAGNIRVLADALAGLHHAHEATDFDGTPFQLVHRDFSPHNIFVTYDGQTKVLDFGIAHTQGQERSLTGSIRGKVGYMAPEQMTGEEVDRRTDIFAAGMVLWEILTGTRPWKTRSDVAIMNQVLNGEIPPPREVEPSVPERLDRLCMKALAQKREDRFSTAALFQQELEDALTTLGSPLSAREIGRRVGVLFDRERRETKKVIQERVNRIEDPDDEVVGKLGDLIGTRSRAIAMTGKRPARKSVLGMAAAVILLSAAGAAAIVAVRSPRAPVSNDVAPTSVPSVQPTSSARALPAPPLASTQIEFRIRATPNDARLFFDDEPLAGNPVVHSAKGDGTEHSVRAEAPGHEPQTVTVMADKDAEVVLRLSPTHTRAAAGSRSAGGGGGGATASVSAGPAATIIPAPPQPPPNGCNPPYYFDAQGVKRFKRECL